MRIIDLATSKLHRGYWIDYDPKTKTHGITPGTSRRYKSLDKAKAVIDQMMYKKAIDEMKAWRPDKDEK